MKRQSKSISKSITSAAAQRPTERNAVDASRGNANPRAPRFAVKAQNDDGRLAISPSHSDFESFSAQRLNAFGTSSDDFANNAFGRLAAIMRRKGARLPTQEEINAGLAAVDGLQPRDEIEAMLAIQMVATHETAMEMLTRAKQAEFMPQLQECGTLAVKLLRTYTAQVEALARLRRGGEQKVVVQHVYVNEGGQAIVGNVNQPGGGGK
jgi:hypothetical protein